MLERSNTGSKRGVRTLLTHVDPGVLAVFQPPWGPMGAPWGLWGPHGAPWGAVGAPSMLGAPWGAVWAVWGTQLLVSRVFARIFVIISIFAFSADFHDFLENKLATPSLGESGERANPCPP